MILLVAVTLAVELDPAFGGFVGFGASVNDPFQNSRGLRGGVLFQATPYVGLALTSTWFPRSTLPPEKNPDWTPLSRQLLGENKVAVDLSYMTFAQTAMVRFEPFQTAMGSWGRTGVGAHAGFGIVHTKDDLVALQAQGEEPAMATQYQWHPAPVWGVDGFIRASPLGLRLGMEWISYLETVNQTTLERKTLVLVSADVTLCSR